MKLYKKPPPKCTECNVTLESESEYFTPEAQPGDWDGPRSYWKVTKRWCPKCKKIYPVS